MPENVLSGGYTNYIKSKNKILLSNDDVEKLIKQIETNRYERSYKTNREHVKHLKQNHSKTRKEPTFE